MIVKYQLPFVFGIASIPTPKGAKFLTAQEQNGMISFWFDVEETSPIDNTTVAVVSTGTDVPDTYNSYYLFEYKVTIQFCSLVHHVFFQELVGAN